MSTAISVFRPNAGGTVNLSVTTSSARVSLATTPTVTSEIIVRLYNSGSVTVFVEFGTVAVTASTTTSMPLPAGAVEAFSLNGSETYVAAIAASGTATLYATPGSGV